MQTNKGKIQRLEKGGKIPQETFPAGRFCMLTWIGKIIEQVYKKKRL